MNKNPDRATVDSTRLPAVIEKPTVAPHLRDNFCGYTLRELRFQRTLTDVRREYVKEKLMGEIANVRTLRFLESKKGNGSAGWLNPSVLALAGKAFKIFSYADYISLGITLFQSGRKVFSLFRRKK